mmetsp:Transcript_30143/g.65837  ORF Transcript_30143/g.65837 Transcript_30143/m.65837 type:complete len:274 (+) Transcript_30143:202-1023(+)
MIDGPTEMKVRRAPRAFSRAASVLSTKLLDGMPSVTTTTIGEAPSRACDSNSSRAKARASAVFVLPFCQTAAPNCASNAVASAVRSCETAAEPPNTIAATFTPPSATAMREAAIFAKFLAFLKPSSPVLPEASKMNTTSSKALQRGDPAQSSALHGTVSRRAGSSASGHSPAPRADRMTERRRTRWPLRHDLLQFDQAVHSASWQSSSQGSALQSCSWVVSAVGAPPCSAFRRTDRRRVLVPPPQDCVHFDHSDHLPIRPSTGHGFSLQGSSR